MKEAYQILLYYFYAPIDDPEKFAESHQSLCLSLNLRGRIIIASEGINGTVSGLKADCEKYMQTMKDDPQFAAIDFKIDTHHQNAFAKLNIRIKPEIVNSGLNHIDPNTKTGTHLSPAEFKKMKDREDVVLLDVRSNYEHNLGKFKGAVTADIAHFREFPEQVKELDELKEKKIITYCTGGIKCEKASAWLLEQGFENVYQLHGGIIKYGMEEGGEDFEGKCYVFDNRVAVDINQVNPKVISTCYICKTPCDDMINCANPECNLHVPLCENCGKEYEGACSAACKDHPGKRTYDGTGYYQIKQNGYDAARSFQHSRNALYASKKTK